ncbi:MAG: hypothetical protein M0R40_11490 [Firmicutes bacterium]|nr:hypothetical protein [Bacillota bacterium]
MGYILSEMRTRRTNTVYANRAACRQCQNKCTVPPYKNVSFEPDSEYVPVLMNRVDGFKLPKFPSHVKLPDNFKKQTGKQILIRIRVTKKLMKERMCLSEHPFGTVKWNDGAHYVLCRGNEKAAAELRLSFLTYNMRRATNMIGIKTLIAAI